MLFLFAGCTGALRIPGPLGSLGEYPPPGTEASSDTTVAVAPISTDVPREMQGLIKAATYYLQHAPSEQPDDCSGYVCAVFTRAGLPLEGNTVALWDRATLAGAVHHRHVPDIGDIAFFDNTYDRNGNGLLDDELTHVALVVGIRADSTIVMAHGGSSKGRTTLVMNLRSPDVHVNAKEETVNDYLRVKHAGDAARTQYLAGELWRGFATVRERDREAWMGEE